MSYKIEKNIPIQKYPFADMEIGDSFCMGSYTRDKMIKAYDSARRYAKRTNMGYKFKVKKTEKNELRVWRIK